VLARPPTAGQERVAGRTYGEIVQTLADRALAAAEKAVKQLELAAPKAAQLAAATHITQLLLPVMPLSTLPKRLSGLRSLLVENGQL